MSYILSFIVAFGVTFIAGQILVPLLRKWKAGQSIREDGPTWHMSKQGTPTMGGLMFILGILCTLLLIGWTDIARGDFRALFVFCFALVFGVIGYLDDYEKVKKKENTGLTAPQKFLLQLAAAILFTVLMRRSMLRIAKLVADQSEMEALITGESLAQVASQTMQAIACTDAAQNLPILRPLIGMDKTEIIAISRKIGTFDTSIEPYEDCCTIFTPPHPKTKPSLAEIEAAEAGMPGLAELERIAAETVEKIPIRIGDDPEF